MLTLACRLFTGDRQEDKVQDESAALVLKAAIGSTDNHKQAKWRLLLPETRHQHSVTQTTD